MKTQVLEYWIPLLLWLLLIFFFSTDIFSSDETSDFIVPLLTFFFPGLSPQQIDFWHGVIRKCGHITEYFILAGFVYRSLKYDQPDLVQVNVRAVLFVLGVALLDEFHQGLTVSRSPSIVDVGYDCLGGVWALWLITTYEIRRLHSHSVL